MRGSLRGFGRGFAGALCASVFVIFAVPAYAEDDYQTPARAAVLLELETNTVLYEKNGERAFPPASLSKLATIYYTFRALQRGQIALDDTFLVSEKAWRMGGSKMFVEVGKEVSIENLLRGVIVSSGNRCVGCVGGGVCGQ